MFWKTEGRPDEGEKVEEDLEEDWEAHRHLEEVVEEAKREEEEVHPRQLEEVD